MWKAFVTLVILLGSFAQKSGAVYKLDLEDLLDPTKADQKKSHDNQPVESISMPPTEASTISGKVTAEENQNSSPDPKTTKAVVGADAVMQGEVIHEQKELVADTPRVYGVKKLSGGGCPYTASWLAHTNLYKSTGWYLHSTKMESASFNIFSKARFKYQMVDPAEYYVHHMSMYEHLLHKRDGFDVARNKSQILSDAAFQGECFPPSSQRRGLKSESKKHHTRGNGEYLTLVPFYGGLPPEVTADFSKVKSIGQGNSLVPPSIKVLQCLATVCSTLKYFGHAVVGVARDEDMKLVQELLAKTDSHTRHHTHVVHLNMSKPSNLPFHLLAWGQQFIRKHNCETAKPLAKEKVSKEVENDDKNVYEICDDTAEYLLSQHPAGVVSPQVMMNFRSFPHVSKETVKVVPLGPEAKGGQEKEYKHPLTKPIRFVYYTEMDQILRFDSVQTVQAISAASNSTCFFSGRRREKDKDSAPEDYMGQLTAWRECGEFGYSFTYPGKIAVHKDAA